MLRHILIIALSIGTLAYSLSSCQHEPYDVTKGNFPAEISGIMVSKCATTGCHDAAGAVNAAKLRLDSWEELFKGSSHGAVVVPYSTKYSSLLYYINIEGHANTDIVAGPTMPYNAPPLSEEQYNILKNWIANGAPDAAGNVAFASDAGTRQKIYITQQGCEDLLTVIDAKSGLAMRHIPVGTSQLGEQAHYVKTSPDGRYAYVCFYAGTVIQKIDTRTDQVVGIANIGAGNWNVINISADGSKLAVSGLSSGFFTIVNTATMSVVNTYNGVLIQPHGIAATPNFDTFYVTSQLGNVVYRLIPDDNFEPVITIPITGTEPTYTHIDGVSPDPHEILFSPDHSRLFVTCENTSQVKVIDITTLQVIATIPVGAVAKELAVSKKRNLVFVTCTEDPLNQYSNKSKGSVYAIDVNTLQKVGNPIYGDFYQPHGIAIDEQNDLIYIASRNINADGPAPHHSSGCDGRNGWYTIYNLNTLHPKNNIRYEITPDPYGADVRFK